MDVEHARKIYFTGQDFQRTRKLIHEYADRSKRKLVYGRLTRRPRAAGIKTFAKYLQSLVAR